MFMQLLEKTSNPKTYEQHTSILEKEKNICIFKKTCYLWTYEINAPLESFIRHFKDETGLKLY